jgi:hypothetical protein
MLRSHYGVQITSSHCLPTRPSWSGQKVVALEALLLDGGHIDAQPL